MVDICNDVSIFCVDIEAAHVLAKIASIDNGFGNVTDKDDIPDLEAPTECEDKEIVSELKTCASKASLLSKEHEDHDDDVEPSMSVNDDNEVEVDCEFYNNAAFVQRT